MDIPATRKREFQESERTFIVDAIGASGLDPKSIELSWTLHSVSLNGAVELLPVLFDCRGMLDTPCWLVRRTPPVETSQPCSCGALVRDAASGVYGSLRSAVAASLGEAVRSAVLQKIADPAGGILKERLDGPAPASPNDFIAHCVHT